MSSAVVPERVLPLDPADSAGRTVETKIVPGPFEAALDPIVARCGPVAEDRLADRRESSEAKNRRVEVGAVVFAVAWFMSTSLELVARSSTVQSLGSELGGRTVSCTNPGCGQHS